ncbi:hypothetical protein G7Y89_g1266 [Cudoniella acicularis]|uniref:Heterokaryon incompatibility domain-containing protein n=1 Tax=Cudoniella acicularis TaxID=354080 RepID=A0A8H4RWF1_9HELO|nr:hypothetical protein G7Y89_g1266 [Cudoniella acicularis]
MGPNLKEVVSDFPPKISPYRPWEYFKTKNDLSIVKQALCNGLNPNMLWAQDELVECTSGSGCTVPLGFRDEETWPHWNTPLHRALLLLDFDSAEFLLQHGADINLYNSAGRTALHEAVHNQQRETAAFLIKHGANVDKLTIETKVYCKYMKRDICGHDGDVALHVALSNGDAATFCLLVEAGADLKAASYYEWTILDLALLSQDRRALEILLSHIDKFSIWLPPSGLSITKSSSDYSAAARDLLAIATSSRLIPPRELYEVYRHVFSLINLPKRSQWGLAAVDDLIEVVFNELHRIANLKRKKAREQLCSRCLEFQFSFSRSCENDKERSLHPFRFLLHEDREQLNNCAHKGCPLCGLAADALDKADGDNEEIWNLSWAKKLLEPSFGSLAVYLEPFCQSKNHVRMDALAVIGPGRAKILPITKFDDNFIVDPQDSNDRDLTTGSPQALRIARRWLDICKSDAAHAPCQQSYHHRDLGGELPTRVLDVADPRREPFLFEGKGSKAPYCTLSYCWGSSGNSVTTRANLAEHMAGIPMGSLPAVMQDAIHTARSLGYQYIWIDALCIIQDGEDDWGREASRMQEIYLNADLTISSLVAKDCTENLFQPRSLRTPNPVPLDLWLPKQDRPRWEKGHVHYLAVYPGWVHEGLAMDGPVHLRGWTLQEQMLSTRILYFGAGILHWECLYGYTTEADPGSSLAKSFAFLRTPMERSEAKHVIKGVSAEPKYGRQIREPYDVWQSMLVEYTRRSLTKPSDRMPAFLAISKHLEKAVGNKFVAGIWEGDKLLESLCWKVKQPDSGMPKTPSWTWASVAGEISFEYVDRVGRGPDNSLNTTVISLNVQTNQSQNHISGSITLKGTLHQKKVVKSSLEARYESPCHESFDYEADVVESCYAFDIIAFEKGPLPTGYGYPMWPEGRKAATVRMLLQPVDCDPTMFRRVGIGIYDNTGPMVLEHPRHVSYPSWIRARRDQKDIPVVPEIPRIPRDPSPDRWIQKPPQWSREVVWSQADRVITIV